MPLWHSARARCEYCEYCEFCEFWEIWESRVAGFRSAEAAVSTPVSKSPFVASLKLLKALKLLKLLN